MSKKLQDGNYNHSNTNRNYRQENSRYTKYKLENDFLNHHPVNKHKIECQPISNLCKVWTFYS